MTNLNPLGEAVTRYFIDNSQTASRPQACDSYTVLPDDNSTMSKDCTKVGWNGTHADGKWSEAGITGRKRILKAMIRVDGPQPEDTHYFKSTASKRNCDDSTNEESMLSAGDTWAIFVR